MVIASGTESELLFWLILLFAGALGVLAVVPIGGADMPVVISTLNAFTGLSAAAAGIALDNTALIVAGMLVGASGSILTKQMADAMNRSIANVFFAGVGTGPAGALTAPGGGGTARSTSAADVAIQLSYARLVVVVPGYGMAVAQAQRAVADLASELEKRGVEVLYAIHPVAGRMPGHMNVLLAEADVPYDKLKEMDDINGEFAPHRRQPRDRRQRRHEPGRADRRGLADLRHADPRRRQVEQRDRAQALDVLRASPGSTTRCSTTRRPRCCSGTPRPRWARSSPRSRRSENIPAMEEEDKLRDEIDEAMEQVMEAMGVGTLMIPDEVQRGMQETTNPTLDVDGPARAARRPPGACCDEFRAARTVNGGWPKRSCACAAR